MPETHTGAPTKPVPTELSFFGRDPLCGGLVYASTLMARDLHVTRPRVVIEDFLVIEPRCPYRCCRSGQSGAKEGGREYVCGGGALRNYS
jgi:hypothetical protein